MGFVLQELAEPGQTVRGVIIALEDDIRIRRALAMTPMIDFFRYQMTFKLVKGVASVPSGKSKSKLKLASSRCCASSCITDTWATGKIARTMPTLKSSD